MMMNFQYAYSRHVNNINKILKKCQARLLNCSMQNKLISGLSQAIKLNCKHQQKGCLSGIGVKNVCHDFAECLYQQTESIYQEDRRV